ncbi:MAG TPA: hypothetical protein VFA71_15390 [Terriglobales bacterium]|nr:hypothetical protein [Terriglobales bacterium]
MWRTSFFAGLAILAITVSIASAQGRMWQGGNDRGGVVFNGIPASATSITPNNIAPGIPASATSITPAPPNIRFNFNRPIFRANGFDHQGDFHRHHRVVAVPVAVPVYYPYDTTDYSDQQQQQPSDQQQENDQAAQPAPTIFESRPGYQPPPVKAYQPMAPPASAQADNSAAPSRPAANPVVDNTPTEPEPTTILVFRDGHQLEIGNYAIVGDTLYNLTGNYKSHKIMLADLDLDKTAKVNQDRGYDFRLPQQGN